MWLFCKSTKFHPSFVIGIEYKFRVCQIFLCKSAKIFEAILSRNL